MAKKVYTVSEVADLVGFCEETVRRHIRKDDLKAVQFGNGHIRVSRTELEKWWSENGGGTLFPNDDEEDQT